MRYIRDLFDKFLGLFFTREEILKKPAAPAIDLSDLIGDDFCLTEEENEVLADDFKIFLSKDDYNREFLYVFQTFKSSFFLDYTHKDGHFRV